MKLGILTNDIGVSQKGYHLIRNLNILSEKHPLWMITVFRTVRNTLPLQPNFSIMTQSDGWTFDGIVIATDLDTAYKAKQWLTPTHRFFYVWELEWLYLEPPIFYHKLISAYNNSNMPLIARSDTHATAIRDAWQPTQYTMENFNYKTLEKIVQCATGNT